MWPRAVISCELAELRRGTRTKAMVVAGVEKARGRCPHTSGMLTSAHRYFLLVVVSTLLLGCEREGSSSPSIVSIPVPQGQTRPPEGQRESAIPYPLSAVIKDVTWDSDHVVHAAPGSDLWPMTWASDGNVYTAWGDGGGFGGTNSRGRVSMGFARLDGVPPELSTVNVNGGAASDKVPTWGCDDCGKTAGLLSVSGVIYAWVNEQNGNPPDVRLYWSNDLAATWQRADWSFPDPADPQFFPSTFLNFGRDYQDARDDYVYSYGGKWIWAQGKEDNVYLARAPKTRLSVRGAYEFFAGLDKAGNPTWERDIINRKPVFKDENGVNNSGLVNVVHNSALKRYILISSHRNPGEPTKTGLGRLGIFDGPSPWGPWTTVAYYDKWLGLGDSHALAYDIPTKWISADGRAFWMTYSSPTADRFNLIKGTFNVWEHHAGME
jgi:hypothetical protein